DRGPSIFVEPNPDSVTENDCKRYGLKLFAGSAEQFFDYLADKVPTRPTPLELIPRATRRLLPAGVSKRTALSFAADFELVPGKLGKTAEISRFPYGHLATWQDLENDKDIARPITPNLMTAVEEGLRNADITQKIILLLDDTGGGKTTVVRRCAYELAKRGLSTLICSALSRIEPLSTADAIDSIDGPLVIIVDNFADQVSPISEIVQRLEKKDVVFLCTERRYRQRYISQSLSRGAFLAITAEQLRAIDAERLIDLYLNEGLIGAAQAISDRSNFSKSAASDPIAIACCRILNDFKPLDRIIDSLALATSREDTHTYLICALAQHCYRGGIRGEILGSIANTAGWQRQFKVHPMPITYFDNGLNFIVPENATLANRVLDRTAKREPEFLLTVFIELANAIAPRVNPYAVKLRVPEARLASRLFDFDQTTGELLG
ncbi:MAG: hypothetical protein ACRDHZ_24870, partial [Ktedonobacteraceae bacterium]